MASPLAPARVVTNYCSFCCDVIYSSSFSFLVLPQLLVSTRQRHRLLALLAPKGQALKLSVWFHLLAVVH